MLDYGEAIDGARLILTDTTAAEIAAVYTDVVVFPWRVVIERPGEGGGFPDWNDDVLVIAVENQGVCSWGLSLGGDHDGAIVVGGELAAGTGTTVYCDSLEAYVAARRWDRECLEGVPMLQAQASPLDPAAISFLRDEFNELPSTAGWPCQMNRRFQRDSISILLWPCDDQCDWWVSGDGGALALLLPTIDVVSDLKTSLWSNDIDGEILLATHRSGG